MQCGECENPQHYLHCSKNPKPDEIKRCINIIAKWMSKVGTSKPLKITILKAMKAWLKDGEVGPAWTFPHDADHASLPEALDEQKHFGWHNFFKGRISLKEVRLLVLFFHVSII